MNFYNQPKSGNTEDMENRDELDLSERDDNKVADGMGNQNELDLSERDDNKVADDFEHHIQYFVRPSHSVLEPWDNMEIAFDFELLVELQRERIMRLFYEELDFEWVELPYVPIRQQVLELNEYYEDIQSLDMQWEPFIFPPSIEVWTNMNSGKPIRVPHPTIAATPNYKYKIQKKFKQNGFWLDMIPTKITDDLIKFIKDLDDTGHEDVANLLLCPQGQGGIEKLTNQQKNTLKENHMFLIDNLILDRPLLSKFLERSLLSHIDVLRITLADYPFDRNTRFLHILYFKPAECYKKFLDCLVDVGQSYIAEVIQSCEDLDGEKGGLGGTNGTSNAITPRRNTNVQLA